MMYSVSSFVCHKYRKFVIFLFLFSLILFQSKFNYDNTVLNSIKTFKSDCACRQKESIILTNGYSENTYRVFSTLDDSTFYVNTPELYSTTCGLYETLRHKRNQKVIGMSLFGNNTKYSKLLEGYLIFFCQTFEFFLL